jgi:F0F1-type ATP synthase delta subunit
MKPKPQVYAQALYDQLLETPVKRQKQTIRWFVDTVRQHKQLADADEIISAFQQIASQREKLVVISIISAQPLNNLLTLSYIISQKMHRDIELRNFVKPDLIGGIIIRYQNYKIDLSVRSQVNKARNNASVNEALPSSLTEIITQITDHQDKFFQPDEPVTSSHVEIVNLFTAHPVKITPLEKFFSARLKEKIIIHYHQDPQLIAGAVIRYDHTKVDMSLDQALDEVRE